MVEYMTTESCNEKHKETMALLTEINNRLYKDNGTKSIQTRLNEHDAVIATIAKMKTTMTGLIWLVIAPILTFVILKGFELLKGFVVEGRL